MEFDRNRYFRLRETSKQSTFLVTLKVLASQDFGTSLYMNVHPSPRKNVKPPSWLGWALLTTGGVICLHAMVLPKTKK